MSSNGKPDWQFFTNHFEILLYVARHPDARLRTSPKRSASPNARHTASSANSSRTATPLRARTGRRNHYRLTPGTTLRHRANQAVPIQPLLDLVNPLAQDLHADE